MVATSRPTTTSGSGEANSLLKVSERDAVVSTAQLVVASSRVRHTVLR